MELRWIVSHHTTSKHTHALAVAATVSMGLLGAAERVAEQWQGSRHVGSTYTLTAKSGFRGTVANS